MSQRPLRILGIDPGSRSTGFGIIDVIGREQVYVASGCIKTIPKDEPPAVSQDTLIGRVGVIVIGQARTGSPAQVRVKDGFGQTHYVMAEPDGEGVLKQGEAVLLVSLEGNTFKAILNPSGSLVD